MHNAASSYSVEAGGQNYGSFHGERCVLQGCKFSGLFSGIQLPRNNAALSTRARDVSTGFKFIIKVALGTFFCRHANIGDAPAGHTTNVGQRITVVLLRLLHLRHCGCAVMAGYTATAMLHPQGNEHNLAQVSRPISVLI